MAVLLSQLVDELVTQVASLPSSPIKVSRSTISKR